MTKMCMRETLFIISLEKAKGVVHVCLAMLLGGNNEYFLTLWSYLVKCVMLLAGFTFSYCWQLSTHQLSRTLSLSHYNFYHSSPSPPPVGGVRLLPHRATPSHPKTCIQRIPAAKLRRQTKERPIYQGSCVGECP